MLKYTISKYRQRNSISWLASVSNTNERFITLQKNSFPDEVTTRRSFFYQTQHIIFLNETISL